MLFELTIYPLGRDTHISSEVAECLRIIEQSGLRYKLNPSGTCIEGEWDEVMQIVKRCHARVRERSTHVITEIRIEDDEGQENIIDLNVTSVEQTVGHELTR